MTDYNTLFTVLERINTTDFNTFVSVLERIKMTDYNTFVYRVGEDKDE